MRIAGAVVLFAATLVMTNWGSDARPGAQAEPDLLRALVACGFFGLLSVILAPWLGGFSGPVMRGGYVDSPTPGIVFVLFGYFLIIVAFLSAIWAS